MSRKMNPKSQENDRQYPGILQIPLLLFSENAMQIKGDWVLHRGLNKDDFKATTALTSEADARNWKYKHKFSQVGSCRPW